MIERVKAYISSNHLIPRKKMTVFAAVSGGIDSCVLLDILFLLQKEFNFNLEIVHFNHNVRGKASHEDAEFVRNLAQKYNLRFHLGKIVQKPVKISETFLRDERYRFFGKLLEQQQSSIIATGHNRDDNIETFIMRLVKGSRMKGLLAIAPQRGKYIRPMLAIRREEIEVYAKEHSLEFRQDKSNFDESILRNLIRHKILPFLELELQVDLKSNLTKVIDDLILHFDIYEEQLKSAIKQCIKRTKTGITLNRKRYSVQNLVIRKGLIEYCISSVYPLNYNLSNRNFAIWDEFIFTASSGKKLTYLENGIALAERNNIYFGEMPDYKKERYSLSPDTPLDIENKFRLELTKVEKNDVHFSGSRNVEFIDGSKIGNALLVRFWQPGDVFKPLGMSNWRKLSDFFVDLKLTARLKKETPLVCKGNNIIWIAGFRLNDEYKISDKTKEFFKLEIKKLGKK